MKSKQKHEQKQFTERLLHDLDLEKSQRIDKKANLDKKFLNVDQVQDVPVPSHTHDPIGGKHFLNCFIFHFFLFSLLTRLN